MIRNKAQFLNLNWFIHKAHIQHRQHRKLAINLVNFTS